MDYDQWQKDLMSVKGHKILCTGRRVGKTTIFAAMAAQRMVEQPNCEILAVSLTEDQAFLMRIMVEDYIKEFHKDFLKVPKSKKPTKNKIYLRNGSTYTVRPVGADGNAVRGFNAHVLIVDEAAYMPEKMWIASKPTLLTTGGEIWMCSTPAGTIDSRGEKNYFYECFINKDNRFKVFQISSEEVVTKRPISKEWTAERRVEVLKFLEEEKRDMSELRYAQEYLGKFVDEMRRYFSDEWIEKICTQQPENPIEDKDYYLGVDIARMGNDESTFEVIRRINKELLIHCYNETAKKKLTTWTEDRIKALDTVFKFRKIYLDAGSGSLGVGIFDHLLREDQTKRKVEAINNRALVLDREGKSKQRLLKEDLYDNLKALGERGHIKLLNNDEVRLSLRSVQYEYVKNPNTPTKFRIFGNYTHIVEGIIRAAWCSKEKNLNTSVYGIKI